MNRWFAGFAAAILGLTGGLLAAEPPVRTLVLFTPGRPLVLGLDIRLGNRPLDEAYRRHLERLLDAQKQPAASPGQSAARVLQLLTGAAAPDAAGTAAAESAEQTLARLEATAPALVLEQGAGAGRTAGPALFPLLDVNGDGVLTADELQACESLLRARDFDDDGAITADELALDNKPVVLSGKSAAEPLVAALAAPADLASLAGALVARYDRNGDGQLSCGADGEIDLPAALLSRLDRDGNGTLSPDELAGWIAEPDVHLGFDFGAGVARTGRRRPQDAAEVRVHAKLDGGYRVSLPGAQIDFRRDNRNPAQAVGDGFRLAAYDADANGYLDENEIKNVPLPGASLAAMDRDGDGKVFAKEFQSFVDRQGDAVAGRLLLSVIDQGHDLFALLDLDQDGRLTRREMRAAADVLAAADRDGDGRLGATEIPRQFQLELARGAGNETPIAAATGGRMRSRPQATPAAAGPEWFTAADRNGDGDVSAEEFIGPAEVFARLDTDGDGLISAAEAAAGK